MTDQTITDPDKYRVVFENERVMFVELKDGGPARPSDSLGPS